MGNWVSLGFSSDAVNRLRKYYTDRQKATEVKLGLRPVPLSPTEVGEAWVQRLRHEALFERMKIWRVAGQLKDGDLLPAYTARAAALVQKLEGYSRLEYPRTRRERLDVVHFIIEAVTTLQQADAFTSPEAEQKVLAALRAEKESLEVLLGLRSAPQTQAKPIAAVAPTTPAAPQPPAAPAQPVGERLRRSILSERTLQALIFLGIFLLFTAAVSFVISGWQNFTPALRVGIPTLFTLIFMGLGWLVRTKTKLYRSGIALSAITALLFPIDAYTIYINIPALAALNWAHFWVIASIFSLLFYIFLTLQIQSRFFGYLVVVALGSLMLAGMEVVGLPRDSYGAGLSVLAIALLFTATGLARGSVPERLRVFVDPFRYLGLWLPAILMPLTMGQWLVTHAAAFDALQIATTITWFLGGFIFGWGAVRYRSVGLGRLAAAALPIAVFMGQLALFHHFKINNAWHAFGLACLTPLYFITAYRLSMQSVRKLDPMYVEHADTANNCGWMLVVIAAILSLLDLSSSAPAAATHFILAASVAIPAILWKRPRGLHLASFFALTASSFLMTELHFKLNQLGVGWAALAIFHLFLALWLARFERGKLFLSTLVSTAYNLAALAVLPAIVLYDNTILTYTLGNFIALSAWCAALAYRKRPGFYLPPPAEGAPKHIFYSLRKRGALFHWSAALPLPFWLWTVIVNKEHPANFSLALAFAALAWGMVAASHWLRFTGKECRHPWRFVGLLISMAAQSIAFSLDPYGYTPSITILAMGLLYFADALASRQTIELYPAGLVTAWGLGLLLEHARVDWDVLTFALCLLVGVYLLCGLLAERRKLSLGTPRFLAPLYHSAHIVALIVLIRIYSHTSIWTDQIQLWGSLDQLLLAALYALFAWGRYSKPWAFISIWLAVAGGVLLVAIYSSGQGSLAAKAALIVAILVLTERTLYARKGSRSIRSRLRAGIHLLWELYRQPLLFTGWAGALAVIGVALLRNYLLLGGGRVQQIWAAVALLIITALYALSARLFKQARFVWFAVALIFIPWTILANLGWFVFPAPAPSQFAISWMGLAWAYFLVSLLVRRFASKAYITPLTTTARLLTPFSLLWAPADVATSRITVGIAIGLYGVAAWEDHRQNRLNTNVDFFAASKFLYPTLALIPVWCVYWLKFLQPAARHEHFGLLLLGFGAVGLLAGQLLERLAPRPTLSRPYGLPAYITGYISVMAGLLLTAHIPGLLAFALLYAALLMGFSAWLFKSPAWVYPAAAAMAFSLLTTIGEIGVPLERRGWWLIGLATLYLGVGWLLRRFKLDAYARSIINIAFMLIPLGLPASSQDRVGAFWGYGSAALLYILSAFWLKQPLLLTAACALIVIPYASALQQSPLDARYYGLALFPGAVLSLGIAYWLDARRGAWRDFPWHAPLQWFGAFAERMLGWWGLSFYILGFGLASAAPFFAEGQAELVSLSFFLLAALYAWAVIRFRGRFWLWASMLALHLAAVFFLRYLGFGRPFDAEFWLRFMPLPALTLACAIWLEKRFKEGSPFEAGRLFLGWSRPLYFFVIADILIGQVGSLQYTLPGMWVTLAHALLIGILASAWGAPLLVYASALLGLIALIQWRSWLRLPPYSLSIQMAWLALGYGFFGFGYRLFLRWQSSRGEKEESQPRWLSVWEIPLQHSAMLLSIVALVMMAQQGIDLVGWSVRALFGVSFRNAVKPETVWMAIWTFSLAGFLYMAASAVYRRLRLGYLAVGLLLASWFLYAFYINIWANLSDAQWYALPAGLYLLAISYVEWNFGGNKRFARWLDYAAMLLLMGSLFWQTLSLGLVFCVLLIIEGLAIFTWGMTRRLRRFFYTGIAGVMLAVLGQLVNGLQNPNSWTWIIWGSIGLLVVVVGILVERKLEAIKAWRQRVLETWE